MEIPLKLYEILRGYVQLLCFDSTVKPYEGFKPS